MMGLLCLPAGTVLPAQHVTRPPDVTDGARIFRSTCALCHGLDGRKIRGVSLGSGQFSHASSDADLTRIIKEGIPNTGMPSNKFSDQEAANIVAYLRTMRSATNSDSGVAGRGRALFEGKGQCLTCHQVNNVGGKSGPELTGIGDLRKADEIEISIVEPDAEVLFSYRTFQGKTRTGSEITGRVLNEDVFTVQIVDDKGRLTSLVKSDLRSYQFLKQSPMPSYRDKLTREELADLVAYLSSLTFRSSKR
jgi:putative heme-binding domain-containing protein